MPCHDEMAQVLHTNASHGGSGLDVVAVPVGVTRIRALVQAGLQLNDDGAGLLEEVVGHVGQAGGKEGGTARGWENVC